MYWNGGDDDEGTFSFNLAYANYMRYSPFLGGTINPYFMAEAIMVDIGTTIVGAEGDAGIYMILAGDEKGKLGFYGEAAGGFGSDSGVAVEVVRIDYSGDVANFNSKTLEGFRRKYYAGGDVGGILSAGGAYSEAKDESNSIIRGYAIQCGIGASILGSFYAGYNQGNVYIK